MDGWKDGPKVKRTNRREDGRMDGREKEQTDLRIYGVKRLNDGWVDGRTDKWIDRYCNRHNYKKITVRQENRETHRQTDRHWRINRQMYLV